VSQITDLTLDDGVRLVHLLGIGPIRDIGRLDPVLLGPPSHASGHDAYGTLDMKAAGLLHSLTDHHAPLDGGKLLARRPELATLRVCAGTHSSYGLRTPFARRAGWPTRGPASR
jgi:hypothetical protein